MPGIDKSRFINIGDNEDELLCGICLAVFVNPMVTQCCQQTYCSDCIREWIKNSKTCPNDRISLTNNKLSQPPRVFINALNKQKLKCDFYESGCLEQILYGRYKQHIRECCHNPEAICSDCGEKNGQHSEHNCVHNLLAKHECLKNLQTNYIAIENSNKLLIEKNANLENELMLSKEKLKEVSIANNLNNSRLEASNKVLSDRCEQLETEMFNLMKNSDQTIKSLNVQLNNSNEVIERYNCRQIINKEMSNECNQLRIELSGVKNNLENTFNKLKSEQNQYNKLIECNRHLELCYRQTYEKCNRYVLQLFDVKSKSQKTINEQKEMLRQNDCQIAKCIEENKRLNENIELLVKNIDKLSLIKQTYLEKIKIGLKINDINSLREEKIIEGKPVYYRGLWWNICAKFLVDDNLEYLSFYLVCNSKERSEKWSCIASIEMSISPQNEVDVLFKNVHKLSCVYSKNVNSFGYNKFIPWFMVIDHKYGYVRDNTVSLNACVSVW